MKEVFAVSAWVCWDEETVLNDVFTVDCEAGSVWKERTASKDGFLNNEGAGFNDVGIWGLMKGCPPFEVFVNFRDFPISINPSEGRFRALPCKER